MSRRHKELVQRQFTKTREAFSVYAVRDTEQMVAEKVAFVKPQAGERTLDVACGPGTLALALAPRVQWAFGVDLTFDMVRQAEAFRKEQAVGNMAVACCDAEQLAFSNDAFDLVTCQYSIHHIPKPELALRELARVTKPEGRLAVIDSLAPESDAKFELHNQIELLRDPSHAETLRLTAFLRLFDECHLDVVRQGVRRRERSFRQWMIRAGIEPTTRRYTEVRELMEHSIEGDTAGFAPKLDGDDIVITHNEGLFLLQRKPADPS